MKAARLLRAGREQLVSHRPSVTYALLAKSRGQNEIAARQWVRRLRNADQLVTVEWQGITLVPCFQFEEAYEPIPEIAEAVKRLVVCGLSGWTVWCWFATVNPWVGQRPATRSRGSWRRSGSWSSIEPSWSWRGACGESLRFGCPML